MKAWDGGRHLDSQGIQCGVYQDDEEEYKLNDFWMTLVCAVDPLCVRVCISELFWEVESYSCFAFKQNTLWNSTLIKKNDLNGERELASIANYVMCGA